MLTNDPLNFVEITRSKAEIGSQTDRFKPEFGLITSSLLTLVVVPVHARPVGLPGAAGAAAVLTPLSVAVAVLLHRA